MSEQRNVDANQTIINTRDEGSLPPPKLEVGLVGWLRQNLFGSPADVVVTILASLLILVLVYGFFDWSIRTANWFTVINNQRLFMMESFEPEFEWRLALTVLLSALLTGLSLAAWARRSWSTLGGCFRNFAGAAGIAAARSLTLRFRNPFHISPPAMSKSLTAPPP